MIAYCDKYITKKKYNIIKSCTTIIMNNDKKLCNTYKIYDVTAKYKIQYSRSVTDDGMHIWYYIII